MNLGILVEPVGMLAIAIAISVGLDISFSHRNKEKMLFHHTTGWTVFWLVLALATARLVIAIAIGGPDNDFDDEEKKPISKITQELGLPPLNSTSHKGSTG